MTSQRLGEICTRWQQILHHPCKHIVWSGALLHEITDLVDPFVMKKNEKTTWNACTYHAKWFVIFLSWQRVTCDQINSALLQLSRLEIPEKQGLNQKLQNYLQGAGSTENTVWYTFATGFTAEMHTSMSCSQPIDILLICGSFWCPAKFTKVSELFNWFSNKKPSDRQDLTSQIRITESASR
jgi:hypothetical protein